MYKLLISFLLVFIFQPALYSQDQHSDTRAANIPEANCVSADALAGYIKQNFTTDSARLRAIFVWIANHINYDYARVQARDKKPEGTKQSLADVLSSRKAVCQGYAELFVALCQGVGINASFIPGYTKKQGKVSTIAHAWVAARLNDNWYLFDPTWGAGYIRNEQFVRKFNNSFYKMEPAYAIEDHMPFDPMLQFLSNPKTYREFADGIPAANKEYFNYSDTLKNYNLMSPVDQAAGELRRITAMGFQNDLIRERQLFLKTKLQSSASKNAFEEAGKAFAGVQSVFNEYLVFKNNQFNTIADIDLQKMIKGMEQAIIEARALLSSAITKTDSQQQAKSNNLSNMDRFWQQLSREKQFVDKYIGTDKAARKQLFMR